MKKWNEINNYVEQLNGYEFLNSNKKIQLSKLSKIYPHNKVVSLIDKETDDEFFRHFKTLKEAEAFIEGLCYGKYIEFFENQEPNLAEEKLNEELELELER